MPLRAAIVCIGPSNRKAAIDRGPKAEHSLPDSAQQCATGPGWKAIFYRVCRIINLQYLADFQIAVCSCHTGLREPSELSRRIRLTSGLPG